MKLTDQNIDDLAELYKLLDTMSKNAKAMKDNKDFLERTKNLIIEIVQKIES